MHVGTPEGSDHLITFNYLTKEDWDVKVSVVDGVLHSERRLLSGGEPRSVTIDARGNPALMQMIKDLQ